MARKSLKVGRGGLPELQLSLQDRHLAPSPLLSPPSPAASTSSGNWQPRPLSARQSTSRPSSSARTSTPRPTSSARPSTSQLPPSSARGTISGTASPSAPMRSTGHEASGSQKQYIIGRSGRASHVYSVAKHLPGLEVPSKGSGEVHGEQQLQRHVHRPRTVAHDHRPSTAARGHRRHHSLHQQSSGVQEEAQGSRHADSSEDSRSCSRIDGEQEGKSSKDIDQELEKIYQDAESGNLRSEGASVNPHSVLGELGRNQVPFLWQGRKSAMATHPARSEGAADLALRRLEEWSGGALQEQELAAKREGRRGSGEVAEVKASASQNNEPVPEAARNETEEFASRLSRVRTKLRVMNQRLMEQSGDGLGGFGAHRLAAADSAGAVVNAGG